MTQVEGYAVTVDDVIDIRTVMSDQRGAMINGLVTLCGVMVTNSWSDEQVQHAWAVHVAYNADKVALAVQPVTVMLGTDKGS